MTLTGWSCSLETSWIDSAFLKLDPVWSWKMNLNSWSACEYKFLVIDLHINIKTSFMHACKEAHPHLFLGPFFFAGFCRQSEVSTCVGQRSRYGITKSTTARKTLREQYSLSMSLPEPLTLPCCSFLKIKLMRFTMLPNGNNSITYQYGFWYVYAIDIWQTLVSSIVRRRWLESKERFGVWSWTGSVKY